MWRWREVTERAGQDGESTQAHGQPAPGTSFLEEGGSSRVLALPLEWLSKQAAESTQPQNPPASCLQEEGKYLSEHPRWDGCLTQEPECASGAPSSSISTDAPRIQNQTAGAQCGSHWVPEFCRLCIPGPPHPTGPPNYLPLPYRAQIQSSQAPRPPGPAP